MPRHPLDFEDPIFEIKNLKLREIANSVVRKYDLKIGILCNLTLDDSGNNFIFFVHDEQDDRFLMLQSSFEMPQALKGEIIDEYNRYLYPDQASD